MPLCCCMGACVSFLGWLYTLLPYFLVIYVIIAILEKKHSNVLPTKNIYHSLSDGSCHGSAG